MMRIALVVAVAENHVIGRDGGLAWKISDDLKWFKKTTMGKPVVMGRKTYDSIGKPLPGRDNIVVTRSKTFAAEGVIVASSIDEALEIAGRCAKVSGAHEICVIGGAAIYDQILAKADRIYLTRVLAEVEGDVRFAVLDPENWRVERAGAAGQSEKNEFPCEFFILERADIRP